MHKIIATVATAGIVLVACATAGAQPNGNGNGNGYGRAPGHTPPGQERRIQSVPEPATLTLLGLGAGGGLLARRWASKRAGKRG